MNMHPYTSVAVDHLMKLVNIPSPTGFTHIAAEYLLDVLREHIHQLQIMRRMLERDDAEGLKNAMERANTIQRIIR